MGNAFNESFLLWTALFSIGLFGLATVTGEIDVAGVPANLGTKFPRKSLPIYVLFLGTFLLYQYLSEILRSYIDAKPPAALAHYTIYELAAFVLGQMVPLHIIGGIRPGEPSGRSTAAAGSRRRTA